MQDPDLPPVLPSPGPRELAHKLNNLLTIVLAQAESSLSNGDAEDMRRALTVIIDASKDMADVVRVYAKTAASRPAPRPAPETAPAPLPEPVKGPVPGRA